MKAKKLNKRLTLNKETIANLRQSEMGAVQGGNSVPECNTETCSEVGECFTEFPIYCEYSDSCVFTDYTCQVCR